jgi:hypothetical protein
MWHQILLAFTRYFVLENINLTQYFLIFLITVILSIFTYFAVEQPFRNKNIIKTNTLFWVVGSLFLLITGVSFLIYLRAGVVRDIPELGITKSNVQRNMHSAYNSRIYDFDKSFLNNSKNIKVLIIGDSFARDWANVLLESKFKTKLEISYLDDLNKKADNRFLKANYIFISGTIINQPDYFSIVRKSKLSESRIWIIGTKNFGISNGVFFKNRNKPNYFSQRTYMAKGYIHENDSMKMQWTNHYIDLIGKVIDRQGKVPVFTPDCKFISEDCRHLTRSGAIYYNRLLDKDLTAIFAY